MDVDQTAPKKEKKKNTDDLSEYKLDDYDEEETEAGAYPDDSAVDWLPDWLQVDSSAISRA